MRSTKIKLSVMCAVAGLLVLSAALATGAGAQSTAAVGSGKASATKSVCGAGTGKKATGKPIKLGGIDMLIPGVDFTTIGKFASCVLQVRERQRRHQRPPDQVHPLQRAAQPDPAGGAGQEARRERQGRGHRRQHELHRVRHELEVLQVQGLHRDRRRRAGGVLRHPDVRRVEHGPALQQHRRRSGARAARREVAHGGLARHHLGLRRRWRAQGRQGRRHPRQGLPDQAPDHRRQLDDPAARAGRG